MIFLRKPNPFRILLFFTAFCLSVHLILPGEADAATAGSEITEDNELIKSEPEFDGRARIGLSLSGGGAKGFAHLGVIRVLEEAGVPIDYITGTSMGALIGGLYAMGYSVDEIETLAVELDWSDLFSDETRRRHIPVEEKEWDSLYLVTLPIVDRSVTLPTGVVAGQRIQLLFNRLAWPYPGYQDFSEFPIPFACVATNLENGELVLLNEGYISDAIRASIAIPSVFTPKKLDGKLLIDGGVVRNLPVEEARDMGADFVIAVNVSAPLLEYDQIKNILDILDQTVSFQIAESMNRSKELADIVLEDITIMEEFGILDFEKIKEIIEKGEELARARMDDFKALAEAVNQYRNGKPEPRELPESRGFIYLSEIEVKGIEDASVNQVKNKMNLHPGTFVSLEDINYGIENVYGMQFYDKVNYRLIEDEGINEYILEVEVQERQLDLFRFGFNYDNFRRASILLNTTYRNLVFPNSISRANVKLGEEPYVDLRFFNYLTTDANFALGLRANYSLNRTDIFSESGDRLATYNTNSFFFEGQVVPYTNNQVMYQLSLRQEFYHVSSRVGDFDFPGGATNITQIITRFEQDNLDRLNFPRRGHNVVIQASQSFNLLNDAINFFQTSLSWNGYFEISDRWVILAGANAGYASRSELPLHRQFEFGGYPDMVGYRLYEISGNNIRMVQLGARLEPFNNRFITVRGNVASTEDFLELDFVNTPLRVGWSISAGINTAIAPFNFALMGSRRNPLLFQYSIGVSF